MRISVETRDALAGIAEQELGGVSLDEALKVVLFRHQTAVALARLTSEPDELADYQSEAARLAEIDTEIVEW